MNSKNRKLIIVILGGLVFFNIVAWQAVYQLNQVNFLEVIFFDVGQGDATLIKTVENHYILIDGGMPGSGLLEKLGQELPPWSRKIDLIILTHAHEDHFGGLIDVIERYEVENILWNGAFEDSLAFQEWKESISESEAEVRIASAGQRIRGKSFFIDLFYPFVSLEGIELNDLNLSSLVLRLVFGENSFLFTGDAYKSIEKQLVKKEKSCQENERDSLCRAIVLNSDILKVGHHGSKTSTAEEFLEAVLPEIAVISAGRDNKHGHPHEETLETLEKYDITILRTDEDEDIKIISNGTNYEISNF